ncbi:MAG: metallophosphoesterase family protein, partial [Candidatus Helarchaeota archaeon]
MSVITWCHCSDAHLGYKQYNLPDRLRDFGKAFNLCIEQIVQKSPDFVIFSGDLFEHYNPNPPELRQAISILRKLKNPENGAEPIPIYIISGNHDVSYSASKRYGGDILDFLQDLGLVHYLKDSLELVKKNGKPIALVAGLRYYGKKTAEKLREFYEAHKKHLERTDIPKILLLHAFVEGTVANFDITAYALSEYPFDYIGIGHYHIRWPDHFSHDGNKIYSAGATEHRTSAEWSYERGFITVQAQKEADQWRIIPEFTSFPVRPKKMILKDFGLTTANRIITETTKTIQENDKKGILLKLTLQGILKKGEFSFLNLQDLKARAKNVLYIDMT